MYVIVTNLFKRTVVFGRRNIETPYSDREQAEKDARSLRANHPRLAFEVVEVQAHRSLIPEGKDADSHNEVN